MRRAITGALGGLFVGFLTLAAVLAVSVECHPYRISLPSQPWPVLCSEPVYGLITYLAFPVNLISNDLSKAVLLSPLSLSVYVLVGVLIASTLKPSRQSRQASCDEPDSAPGDRKRA